MSLISVFLNATIEDTVKILNVIEYYSLSNDITPIPFYTLPWVQYIPKLDVYLITQVFFFTYPQVLYFASQPVCTHCYMKKKENLLPFLHVSAVLLFNKFRSNSHSHFVSILPLKSLFSELHFNTLVLKSLITSIYLLSPSFVIVLLIM